MVVPNNTIGNANHVPNPPMVEFTPDAAVVVIVSTVFAAAVPGMTDAGENEHAANGGTPAVQEKLTVLAKEPF